MTELFPSLVLVNKKLNPSIRVGASQKACKADTSDNECKAAVSHAWRTTSNSN